MSARKPPFRSGRVHVKAERCSDCVFRPGNLMRLNPGRLADLVEQNRERDTAFACHQTTFGHDENGEAICRGYFDAFAKDITPLRMAVALDMIEEQA